MTLTQVTKLSRELEGYVRYDGDKTYYFDPDYQLTVADIVEALVETDLFGKVEVWFDSDWMYLV